MSLLFSCNENHVFRAVCTGRWDDLATELAAHRKTVLEGHKKAVARSGYGLREQRARKEESLLLPLYPMIGIFQMQHQDASRAFLDAWKSDPFVKRMDSSKLLMHLAKHDMEGLVWALGQGWDAHLGLPQSRQTKMQWYEFRSGLKTAHERETVEAWMRKWAKKNPLLLRELHAPTQDECRTMLVDQLYVDSKILAVLMRDKQFKGFFQAIESLDQWVPTQTAKQKALLLRGYFSQTPVEELVLPADFSPDV